MGQQSEDLGGGEQCSRAGKADWGKTGQGWGKGLGWGSLDLGSH